MYHQQLEQIETESTNEFLQLIEIGCEYYETSELHYLKGKCEERVKWIRVIKRALTISYYFLAILFTTLALSLIFKTTFISLLSGSLFLIVLPIVLTTLYILKKNYDRFGFVEYILIIIHEELQTRRTKASINKR